MVRHGEDAQAIRSRCAAGVKVALRPEDADPGRKMQLRKNAFTCFRSSARGIALNLSRRGQ